MRVISSKHLVHKSAGAARKASNVARLRRSAKQPVDLSDLPEITVAGPGESHRIVKQPVTIRLDSDILDYFKSTGHGYQTRINHVLRLAVSQTENIPAQLHALAARLEATAGKSHHS
ncbi:MAG: BrnA antitoxin family protein [Phycisphaerae bacterium]